MAITESVDKSLANPFTDQINNFLAHCLHERRLSQHTRKAYRLDLLQFAAFRKEPMGAGITKESIRLFVQALDGKKPRTIRRKVAALKSFCRYLEDENAEFNNPFRSLNLRISVPRSLPRGLPLDSINTLLGKAQNRKIDATTPRERGLAIRNLAIVELLFATGVRVSELSHLKKSDVDLSENQVRVMGKGSRERILPFCVPGVPEALKAYDSVRKPSKTEYFFLNRDGNRLSEQSIRFMLRETAKKDGLGRVTPHMLRHSVATLLLEQEFDIRYLQYFLGHSSITTTTIYANVTTQAHRRILTNKHPRRLMRVGESIAG